MCRLRWTRHGAMRALGPRASSRDLKSLPETITLRCCLQEAAGRSGRRPRRCEMLANRMTSWSEGSVPPCRCCEITTPGPWEPRVSDCGNLGGCWHVGSLVSSSAFAHQSLRAAGILGMLEVRLRDLQPFDPFWMAQVVESDFGRSLALAETAEATKAWRDGSFSSPACKAEEYEAMTKQNKLTKALSPWLAGWFL